VTEAARITDQRLIPVQDGFAARRYQVLSLDVFDTLLWRRVPEAVDVFLLLGRQLAADGKLAAHVSPLGFSDLRRIAERAAREKVQATTGYREITLADIYTGLPDHLFAPGFGVGARVQAELACERSLLVLDHEVVALLKAAKAAEARVILVSDTYFTSAQLRGLLAGAGFTDDALIDRLYVSCEAGKPKYRDLFDTILTDLGVTPAAMIHVGDTLEADINPCRVRGIAFAHYDKWVFSPRVQEIEFPAEIAHRAALLGDHGDFGLTGLRSRLAHRPPAALATDLRPYWSYGAAVLAPVFAGFARWIVESARVSGTTRIFGIMREGRFLKRAVEAAAKHLDVDLTVEELWLSRRAVVRAALYADDVGLLPEAILLSPGRSTDEVLQEVGLSRADFANVLPAGFELRQPDALMTLVQAISSVPAAMGKVLATSARHRANLLRGLGKAVDLSVAQTVTVIDLGYGATIQTVLGRILKREGHPVQLSGLYLALNDKALINVRGGADLRAYLGTEGFLGDTAALLSRTPDVLEHACMCRDGSLAGYDETGAPVFLPNQREESQLAQMEAAQDGIIAAGAAIDALLGDLDRTTGDTPVLKAQVAQIISAALLHPSVQDVGTIGTWKHEANFDLTDVRRFADLALDPQEFEYRGWPALQELGRHQAYWPAAALQAANPFIGAGFSAGAEEVYGPDHLTAGPLLGGVTICPDLGVGFDTKRQGAVPLAMNAFGRAQMQIVIKPFGADVYRRLRFTWPPVRAVVQIDRVGFNYVGEGYRRAAAPGPIVWSGAQEIAPGVYVTDGTGTPAEVSIALDAPPAWPHALELLLRFKYLKLDPLFGTR
jgi:FMN phosphatase YigB (HAD superfamily)